MKKFLLIICTFLIIFISCSSENKALEKDRIITDKPEIEYTEDDMDTAFGRAVLLTIKASLDSAEILQRNGLEYSTGTGKGLNEEGIYFSELISYMPKGKDGEEIDSKVLNELSEVESEYNESINNLVPDYDEVKGAGLLNIDEETGEIIVSDCEKIALNSIEGIALVEVNNMVANGMTTEEAVEYVQRDIEKVLSSITEESKGIYIPANTTNLGFIRGGKWDKGVVKYYFDNRNRLSDEGKKIVLEAMKEWIDKTGGVIKFEEIATVFGGR